MSNPKMSDENLTPTVRRQWSSIAEFERAGAEPDEATLAAMKREFPAGADLLEVSGATRRDFLKLMSASAALAGVTTLSGCIRKPAEKIVPYDRRPEFMIPGKAEFYATSALIGGSVAGLLVESQDGRPTKIEGNPAHPNSLGATDVWAQATVLELYDNDRLRAPRSKTGDATYAAASDFVKSLSDKYAANGGQGLAVLTEYAPSPTFNALVKQLAAKLPAAKFYRDDLAFNAAQAEALAALGLNGYTVAYNTADAKVMAALDCDFLGVDGDRVAQTKGLAKGRRVDDATPTSNRLYAVEPTFTITGATADNRLRLTAAQIGPFAAALLAELVKQGMVLPDGGDALLSTLTRLTNGPAYGDGKWVPALAKDLLANKGKSIVFVGYKQPAWVHTIGLLINAGLENIGATVKLTPGVDGTTFASLRDLATDIGASKVETLVMFGGNPAYTAPADLDFAAQLGKVATSIHLTYHFNETAKLCTWAIPRAHYLESWGDWQAANGTLSLQQPLIAPLFNSISDIELAAKLVGNNASSFEILQSYWKDRAALNGSFDKTWRQWLHDGVVTVPEVAAAVMPTPGFANAAGLFAAAAPAVEPTPEALEAVFVLDAKVYDGRYANLGWLQEHPDPMTKATWDNAAFVSPKTAKALGLRHEEQYEYDETVVELTLNGKTIEIPAVMAPGLADNVVMLPLGYGRDFDASVATREVGFNVYPLRTSAAPFFAAGATLRKTTKTHKVVTTQTTGYLEPKLVKDRPLARETTLEAFKSDPHVIEHMLHHPPLQSIWKVSPLDEFINSDEVPHQWGMTIDLNSCTACGTCTVACQSENNIPVVGKERVAKGREMHWIRLDRYFLGDDMNEPEAIVQPVGCLHCENAPCEQVCPVAATTHSPEGMNDMAYNRCIGTRYCANNCPVKVRRFNFFNFNLDPTPLDEMYKNPDVTVRFRGVIEKCTYCVQRVQEARIDAKVNGNGVIPDGAVVTACQQACPADAIVFGNLKDENSRVSKLTKLNRNYAMLAEINIKPRTTYLARVRNPNPELA